MGFVRGLTAIGNQPDHVQVIERPDRAQRDGRNQNRFEHRQSNMPKLFPTRHAVHAGCLVKLTRNALHAAERNHHHERKTQARYW